MESLLQTELQVLGGCFSLPVSQWRKQSPLGGTTKSTAVPLVLLDHTRNHVKKEKVSSLLMIILQLDRSRVQSLTLGLSLRSQTSVLRCKMDSAAKPSHRQARDTDNLLSLRFSFNGENVILPMFSRRVKQDSRVIFQATLLSFLPKFPSENYAALYWAQMLSISNKHLLNKKQAYLEKIPRPLAPAK